VRSDKKKRQVHSQYDPIFSLLGLEHSRRCGIVTAIMKKQTQTLPNSHPRPGLRINAFCAALGISRSTFYKYVNAGQIRVVRFGSLTIVPPSEVERLLERGMDAA
jgi:excisionase family DNA binding protein